MNATELNAPGFVVESRMLDPEGNPGPPCSVWVGSRARAEELAGQKKGATVREIPLDQMPADARENLLRARAEV